jgi:hypothetical protein
MFLNVVRIWSEMLINSANVYRDMYLWRVDQVANCMCLNVVKIWSEMLTNSANAYKDMYLLKED